MEKFRIDFRTSIEKFTIVKDLRTQVIYIKNDTYFHTGEPFTREIKENKFSNYASWYDTFEEAKKALVEYHLNGIKTIENNLRIKQEILEKVNEIQYPTNI